MNEWMNEGKMNEWIKMNERKKDKERKKKLMFLLEW